MIALVPSRTAFATSEASARVGSGAWIIDSSICVAVITGFPRSRARRMIRFCSSGTSAAPISTPRSPRATMTASACWRMSSSTATASAFSIFAITCAVEPEASIRVFSAWTSEAVRTKERATKSQPSSSANWRSSMSFFVSDGIGSGMPGRLTPLLELTVPGTITSQMARPRSTLPTRSLTAPSSIRTSKPGWRTDPSTAGAIGRSPSCAVSSPAIVTSSPRIRYRGSESSPTRSLGPCRSAISATGRPTSFDTARIDSARAA